LIKPGLILALTPINQEDPILKFGQIIGFASEAIQPGDHVHVHNVACDAFDREYAFSTAVPPPPLPPDELGFFDGYLRRDGRVGTRNYLAVISTVNCSATVCKQILNQFDEEALRPYPNVDGVIAITHRTGCGMAPAGIDRINVKRTLDGFARHCNVFDYLLVGLGCEVNQPNEIIPVEQLTGEVSPPKVLTIQAAGGVKKTVAAGVQMIGDMLEKANACRRTRQPASKIILGTECGGSDGSSGVSANPAVGKAGDQIVAQGGTVILSETPEIYGAEHLLTRRAVDPHVGQKLIDRIRWWEWYVDVFGATINNNPTVGNKEGGLTTIYEKSLCAIAKGGSTSLVDVYEYAEPVIAKGFVVMGTPGYDPVSVTGMVGGGANVVVFTTGRGSVFGCKPVPSIKIASNSTIYRHIE